MITITTITSCGRMLVGAADGLTPGPPRSAAPPTTMVAATITMT
jgi:hypothetical protein